MLKKLCLGIEYYLVLGSLIFLKTPKTPQLLHFL
jgi:hypothetical protein